MDRNESSLYSIQFICPSQLLPKQLVDYLRQRHLKVQVRNNHHHFSLQDIAYSADMIIIGHELSQDIRQQIVNLRKVYTGSIVCCLETNDEVLEVMALKSGAEGCIALDQSHLLIWMRICTWLKNNKTCQPLKSSEIVFGDLHIHYKRREVYFKDKLLPVNETYYELLNFLVSRAGKIVTRDDIYQALYNREFDGLDRTVDIYISRLRKILQDTPQNAVYLKTVRGKGYLFMEPKAHYSSTIA